MASNRIEYIDLAKGVCIILVVLNHCVTIESLSVIEYLRMPFYFFISGMFFKDYGGLRNLMQKKTNKLLIPFVFFYTLPWIVRLLFISFFPGIWVDDRSFINDLRGCMYLNLPVWFLICLFWCNLYYYFVHKYCKNRYKIFSVIILAIIGCFLLWNRVFCPLFMFQPLLAMPFFYLGQRLRFSSLIQTEWTYKQLLFAITLIAIVVGMHVYSEDSISYIFNNYKGNLLLYYIKAIMMVIAAIIICKCVKKLPLVSYIGRYSIIVLGVHFIFVQIAYYLTNYYGHIKNEEWILFVINIVLSIASIPLFKTLFPHFVAQKDLLKLKD